MNRFFTGIILARAAVTLLAGNAAAQSTGAAFEFKLVNPQKVQRLLPARIVVPDHHSPNGARYVNEDDAFFSFERFRVELNPKRSGHLYIFARTNDGDVEQLYPRAGDGDNYVNRNANVALPEDGWFRFDRHAGQEEVYVIQSADVLNEDDGADVVSRYEESPYAQQDGVLVRRIFLDHRRPE